MSVLKYCVHMATMGSLHAVVLENVHGILEKTQKGKAPSFMDAVLEALRMAVPQFDWQVAVLRAQDFRLPQKRTRVFLRGLRRCFGEVPAPLAPMGELPLEAFLKPNLPPVNRASVTACVRRNLKDAERELLQKWDSGELSAKDIICFPADRASGKTYARVYQKNMVPTLTTSGMYLFLVSVGCLRKPDNKRRYFRFLDSTERLTLQGFKKDVLASSPDCLRRKASGNAYPVPLVAAVLAPMLQQLSRPELQSELDRAPDKSSVKAALAAHRFEEALVSKSTAACNRDAQATHMQQQPKRASQTSSAAASQQNSRRRGGPMHASSPAALREQSVARLSCHSLHAPACLIAFFLIPAAIVFQAWPALVSRVRCRRLQFSDKKASRNMLASIPYRYIYRVIFAYTLNPKPRNP